MFFGVSGKLQPSVLVSSSPLCVSASTSFFGQVSSPTLGVYQMQMGQLSFEVSSGDITKEASDVIINSSNHDFNLKSGDYLSGQGTSGLSFTLKIYFDVDSITCVLGT